MKKKSLIKTNPYLKDPVLGKTLLYQFVSSSTAVEGILTKHPKLSNTMEKKLKEVISVHAKWECLDSWIGFSSGKSDEHLYALMWL